MNSSMKSTSGLSKQPLVPKAQADNSFHMPSIYDTDDELADSKDENDIIPDPSSLLNLKRSLAWSQDEQECLDDPGEAMDITESEEMTVVSFRSNYSALVDLAIIHDDDKENGARPILHWEEHVPSQTNLGSLMSD
jgi:hypothetical protein